MKLLLNIKCDISNSEYILQDLMFCDGHRWSNVFYKSLILVSWPF